MSQGIATIGRLPLERLAEGVDLLLWSVCRFVLIC